MTKPIQAGELCFLRGCRAHPENNGHVVTTIRPHTHEVSKETGWLCESIKPLRVRLHWTDGRTSEAKQKEFFARLDQLIPIRDNDGETDEISRVRGSGRTISKVKKTEDVC